MKLKIPDWLDNENIIELAQLIYNKNQKECVELTKNIYGIGLKVNALTLFIYFKVKRTKVIATCGIITDGTLEGIPKFSLAYAVAPKFRQRGLGKEITAAGIIHFKTRINIKDVRRYYLVSYVSLDNFASQKISQNFFGPHKREICDDHTNERQLEYRMLIEK